MLSKRKKIKGNPKILQLGGLAPLSGSDKYPAAVTGRTQSFAGCVRNLVVNNEMYDLGVPDYVNNEHSQMGCDLNEAVCDINSIYGGYCIHGECIADAVVRHSKLFEFFYFLFFLF